MRKGRSLKRISAILLSATLICALLTGCAANVIGTDIGDEVIQEIEDAIDAQVSLHESEEDIGEAAADEAAANYEFTRDSFPVMDGSTSMVPLGKAVASVLLGESPDEVGDLVNFNKTTQSFRNLKDGNCDILIVGEPNAAVFDEMKEDHFDYELEEIATDALIFVVNKDNPVDNLTTSQIRDIYSGKITNWKEVGGNDAPIVAFQRNEGAGSQALIKKLVMKETEMTKAPTTLIASEMGELMEAVKGYDNSANAIGYSVYYYANDMKKADGLKLISVDGVEPSAETIRERSYPHLNAYYCVIAADAEKESPARILYEWMMSKDGQKLVDAEGYVAAKDPDELDTELPGGQIVKTDYTYYRKLAIPENKFTRLSDGPMKELEARDDYGFIYPYSGSHNYVDDEDGYSYEAGAMKGFFDENARLITDPVYNSIDVLKYYDNLSGTMEDVPIWVFSRALTDKLSVYEEGVYEPEMEYSFATMDGSFVCDKWYLFVEVHDDRIICTTMDRNSFDSYDLSGNKMLSSNQTETWKLDVGKYESGEDWIRDVRYGDGLYLINISFEESYYADETGKTVLGPYANARVFHDGKAVAEGPGEGEGNHFGVINKKGEWIIDPAYQYIENLMNGNFVCCKDETTYEVRDTDGKLLNTVEARFINKTNFGFTSRYSPTEDEDKEETFSCYDFEGNLLFRDEAGQWQTAGCGEILSRKMGAGVQLRNLFTGKTIYVEGADDATPFYRFEDTPDIERVIARNSYYDDEAEYYYCHERVYDYNLEELFDYTGGSLMVERDNYNGDWYVTYYVKGNKVCINDLDFNEIGIVDGYPEIVNQKFIVSDDYACTCYDKDGNIVFSYSMLKSMGD